MLFVNSEWQVSAHLLDNGLDTFYLFSLGLAQHLLQFFALDGSVGVAVLDVDATNVARLQAALLAEEAHDVALGDFVFLALANIDCGHLGKTHPQPLSGQRGE